MTADLIFLVSILFLVAAGYFSVLDRTGRSLSLWRRVLCWIALLALTASVVEFGRYTIVMQRAETASWPFNQRLDVMLRMARIGSNLTLAAFLTCWFGTVKTITCLLSSTLTIGLLWVAQLIGV